MLNVNGGLSNVDRITFYDSEIGATAIRLPDGKIDIKYEKKNVTMESVFGLIVFCSIISLLKALIIIPYIKNHITMIWMYFIPSAFYVIFLVACIKYVREQGKKLLKNHGAEHMVFKAYQKLKRIPNITEVKKFSRISSKCGINIFSAFIMAQIIGFFVYQNFGYIIPEAVLVIVPVFVYYIFPFNFLGNIAQLWTTSEPEDENISLAIAALTALEDRDSIKDAIKSIGI